MSKFYVCCHFRLFLFTIYLQVSCYMWSRISFPVKIFWEHPNCFCRFPVAQTLILNVVYYCFYICLSFINGVVSLFLSLNITLASPVSFLKNEVNSEWIYSVTIHLLPSIYKILMRTLKKNELVAEWFT